MPAGDRAPQRPAGGALRGPQRLQRPQQHRAGVGLLFAPPGLRTSACRMTGTSPGARGRERVSLRECRRSPGRETPGRGGRDKSPSPRCATGARGRARNKHAPDQLPQPPRLAKTRRAVWLPVARNHSRPSPVPHPPSPLAGRRLPCCGGRFFWAALYGPSVFAGFSAFFAGPTLHWRLRRCCGGRRHLIVEARTAPTSGRPEGRIPGRVPGRERTP
jgi:hypothetical protein